MVNNCSVRGCKRKRSTDPGIRLHKLPRNNEEYRKKWIDFCGLGKAFPKQGSICEIHFEEKYKRKNPIHAMYSLSPKNARNLTDDAIPTLNGPSIQAEESMVTEVQSGECLIANSLTNDVEEPMELQLKDIAELATNDVTKTREDVADNAEKTDDAMKGSPVLAHLNQVIEENELVIQSPLYSPEIVAGAKAELLVLRQQYQNLLQRKNDLEKAANASSVNYKIVSEEYEKLQKKHEELEKENRTIHALAKKLQREKREMDNEIQRLKIELNNAKETNVKYEAILQKFFTPGQLRRLLTDSSNKRLHWNSEDIASAISLRCASIKGYRYLKYKRFHPLPHIRTLRRWAQKVSIEEGIMDVVLSLMKHKGRTISERERLTILCYDEMSVDSSYCYCRLKDKIYGEVDKVQVLMARGLTSNWKQPVAFFYDTDMTKDLLFQILKKLHDINFDVVGMVSDLGGTNRSFHKQLQITNEFNSFDHPSDNTKKVFCFSDAPHLLKLFRNHFLDQGYKLDDTEIKKDVIEKILAVSKTELNINCKLRQARHLDVSGNARQRVAPAAELISTKTADLIDHCCNQGHIQIRNHTIVSKVIRAVGKFFLIFNNLDQRDKVKDVEAYGRALDKQKAQLKEIVNVIGRIRQIKLLKNGKNTDALLPFQYGMLMSIKSLQDMHSYLKERYGMEYILTKRLNQDCLENFFGYIRGMGGANDHPSATDFSYRMKLYILGKHHSAVFTMNRNTSEIVEEECLVTPSKSFVPIPTSTPQHPKDAPNPATIFQNEADNNTTPLQELDEYFLDAGDDANLLITDLKRIDEEEPQEAVEQEEKQDEENERNDEEGKMAMKQDEKENEELSTQNRDEKAVDEIWKVLNEDAETAEKKMEKEGFEYVAGYVAHIFRNKYTYLGTKTSQCVIDRSWLQMISKGSMLKPTAEFMSIIKFVESVFLHVHGQDKGQMKKGVGAIGSVLNQANKIVKSKFSSELLKRYPEEVIKYYIRVRIYIRIRCCNERMKAENLKKMNGKKFNNKNNKLGKSVKKNGSANSSNGSTNSSNGSAKSSKGSANSSKGSANSSKGSPKSSKGSANSSKGSPKSFKGSANFSKGSPKSLKGSANSSKGSAKSSKGSANSSKGSANSSKPC